MRLISGRGKLAVVGVLIVVLVLAITGVTALVAPSRAFAASSTLTILTGNVEVKAPGAADYANTDDGALVLPGSSVRTGDDTNAVITLFDGSTITLEPSSEMTLDEVSGNGRGEIFVALTQVVGGSWHVISHTLAGDSHYRVKTSNVTASVRGTAFTIKKGTIETTEGTVAASALTPAGSPTPEVPVGAGKKVGARAGPGSAHRPAGRGERRSEPGIERRGGRQERVVERPCQWSASAAPTGLKARDEGRQARHLRSGHEFGAAEHRSGGEGRFEARDDRT